MFVLKLSGIQIELLNLYIDNYLSYFFSDLKHPKYIKMLKYVAVLFLATVALADVVPVEDCGQYFRIIKDDLFLINCFKEI
jgi:hypothetical protein